MARRKKINRKTKRTLFKLRSSRPGKKRKVFSRLSLTGSLKVSAVVGGLVAVGVFFYFTEKYVKSVKPTDIGPVELVDVPKWVSEQLRARIITAAGGKTFRLDEQTAQLVAQNLASVAWLSDVKVQTTSESVRVSPQFRRPLALVKRGLTKFYVDPELVVLDFVPIPNLPIVKIKGLRVIGLLPQAGQVWQRDDLSAAVAILARFELMDALDTPNKPLLYEIDSIDMSNFNGRENSRAAHIILYTKDNTEIIWGAELRKWQQHLEATDEDKLARLYSYYAEHGSLSGGVKYINLREPQGTIPLPVDKY